MSDQLFQDTVEPNSAICFILDEDSALVYAKPITYENIIKMFDVLQQHKMRATYADQLNDGMAFGL